MIDRFKNRVDAGQRLADKLIAQGYDQKPNLIVLGLPRGGIPVGYEVAKRLHAPLDAFLVRKLGVPGEEELAMGAIALGDLIVFNDDIINAMKIPKPLIDKVISKEQATLHERDQKYRKSRPVLDLDGKIIILVDDGIATGATMRVAIKALKACNPQKIVVAVPVAPVEVCAEMRAKAVNNVVCLIQARTFFGIGAFYRDFQQTPDAEVCRLLSGNLTQGEI